MSEYNFNTLNDKEFESLSADILSKHLGVNVERFKPGRDQGVDGRFFTPAGGEAIIQCKHYLKTPLPQLLRKLEKEEAPKVLALNPARYIFVTCKELNRLDKLKIKAIFSPYIKSDSDIYGHEDLNNLLSRYPDIEQKHYKLWITSTTVLKTILNGPIIGRSRYYLNELVENSHKFVVTDCFNQAIDKLNNKNTLIITGAPGVGKTTLADQLCLNYTAEGYELCFIEDSLSEAEGVYDPEKKQVFYYDDFLGRNYLLALEHHQDSHIVKFLQRIQKDNSKKFILTSRTNILNQGKKLSDLFDINHLNKNEYEITIENLSELEKAKILYNLMYFSDLPDDFIDEIYNGKRYLDIIKHDNFNPRLVSFITDIQRLNSIPSNTYWQYISKTLSNPQGIWKNVFEVQLSALSKEIMIGITLNGATIFESDFKLFFYRLLETERFKLIHSTFEEEVKLLTGALLNRTLLSNNNAIYTLFNPSIADFVLANYMDDIVKLSSICSCLDTTQVVQVISSSQEITDNKELTATYQELLQAQISLKLGAYENEKPTKQLVELLINLSEQPSIINNNQIQQIRLFISDVLRGVFNDVIGYKLISFINWLIDIEEVAIPNMQIDNLITAWLKNTSLDMDDYTELSKLLVKAKSSNKLISSFKKDFLEFYEEDITQDVIDHLSITGFVESDNSEVYQHVHDRLKELKISFDEDDISHIANCCDLDDVQQSYMNSCEDEHLNDDRGRGGFSALSNENPVDDLFDRS